ncbi:MULTISPECIES: DUF305 domain-containing protein [Streptomyces]|uniref:DUF305 domain-containing protein n=1 Tax=Streptomyces gilvifuscus TaxID=1550617 RepID=A0ABT5FWY5_9ACTN|nr:MULTISPECIES: DUF305 domain-containing protein [Streptomyces]MBK3639253.1 DUF305 domain-containing protein [Streptomyces sp. MBT33]MDC2957081.1 DUF305 domain-containing protein [Streptomyces gilvifuscus]
MRNTRTSLVRRTALVATAVTAALVLAGCGNDSGGDSGSSGHHASASASASSGAAAHNDQDMAFAQGMIPHHQQALEMARLAAGRASSPQVKDLASRIEKAQDPEIRTMNGWLKSWGMGMSSAMPGMGHSAMPGMMDAKDMAGLKKMSGKDFDSMFLTMMIEHHKGAVAMAGTEKAKGSYGPAKSMAGDIVDAQTAEITEMNKLLGKG